MKFDKLKLTGLHRYNSSGLAILNLASVGIKLYQRVGRFRPTDKWQNTKQFWHFFKMILGAGVGMSVALVPIKISEVGYLDCKTLYMKKLELFFISLT